MAMYCPKCLNKVQSSVLLKNYLFFLGLFYISRRFNCPHCKARVRIRNKEFFIYAGIYMFCMLVFVMVMCISAFFIFAELEGTQFWSWFALIVSAVLFAAFSALPDLFVFSHCKLSYDPHKRDEVRL